MGVCICLVLGWDVGVQLLAHAIPDIRRCTLAIVCAVVVLPICPRIENAPHAAVLKNRPPSEPAPGLFDFIQKNSSPSDKIFTTGPPGLYVYADRLAAVRESSIIDELVPTMPGATDEENRRPLYENLVKNEPTTVFL